jgi:hypothetical protein
LLALIAGRLTSCARKEQRSQVWAAAIDSSVFTKVCSRHTFSEQQQQQQHINISTLLLLSAAVGGGGCGSPLVASKD